MTALTRDFEPQAEDRSNTAGEPPGRNLSSNLDIHIRPKFTFDSLRTHRQVGDLPHSIVLESKLYSSTLYRSKNQARR